DAKAPSFPLRLCDFARDLFLSLAANFGFVSDFRFRITNLGFDLLPPVRLLQQCRSAYPDFRLRAAFSRFGTLGSMIRVGLASFLLWATLCFKASMRLMTCGPSCAGGATISLPAILASTS